MFTVYVLLCGELWSVYILYAPNVKFKILARNKCLTLDFSSNVDFFLGGVERSVVGFTIVRCALFITVQDITCGRTKAKGKRWPRWPRFGLIDCRCPRRAHTSRKSAAAAAALMAFLLRFAGGRGGAGGGRGRGGDGVKGEKQKKEKRRFC